MDAPRHTDSLSASLQKRLKGARAGSYSSLGSLLELYRDYLLTIANDRVSQDLSIKVAPSDLVQESFMEALAEFPKFRGETDPELKLWLRKILEHNIVDSYRAFEGTEKRDLSLEVSLDAPRHAETGAARIPAPGQSPSSQLIAQEIVTEIMNSVTSLTGQQQDVIRLRCFEGRSFPEIGNLIGLSEEAARKVWTRAVGVLSEDLKTHAPGLFQ